MLEIIEASKTITLPGALVLIVLIAAVAYVLGRFIQAIGGN